MVSTSQAKNPCVIIKHCEAEKDQHRRTMTVMVVANNKSNSILSITTLTFSAMMAVWIIFSVIGLPIQSQLTLSETQFGLLVAMPILSGALLRIPMGVLSARYGGRKTLSWLLILPVAPLLLIGSATEYWQFLALGFLLGIVGAAFSVGVNFTTDWFPVSRRAHVINSFSAGNAGGALTLLAAPALMALWGWRAVPGIYAIALFVVFFVFWLFTEDAPNAKPATTGGLDDHLHLLRDPKIWKYCQYYSLSFGGFIALSVWLTKFFITEYQLALPTAALLTALFVFTSAVARIPGGWLSQRFGAYRVTWAGLWVSWVCLFLLSYPQTDLSIRAATGDNWEFGIGLNIILFSGLLITLGICWGIGKASVFTQLSEQYGDRTEQAASTVGLVGALGGVLLPVMFGLLVDITHISASIFMLLYGATCLSLVLMYATFGRERKSHTIQQARQQGGEEITLQSMNDVVAKQRATIADNIGAALAKCADNISSLLDNPTALHTKLGTLQDKLEHHKYIYVLDENGVQITANLSAEGPDESQLGRDRNNRPYMAGMFSDLDFRLSESYISRNKKRPSLTAVRVIRDHKCERLGFLCVDYDLRDLPRKGAVYQGTNEWRQMKGDPSIRGGLFAQERAQSAMDDHLDDVLALTEELMRGHGIFHGKLHFSSSRATIWHADDPYNYHLMTIDELTNPDTCLGYTRRDYHEQATVPPDAIRRVFEQFKSLRFTDETIYLRAGSLNIINGMVGLNFSCDGSHYLRYDEFLDKGLDFWFGV